MHVFFKKWVWFLVFFSLCNYSHGQEIIAITQNVDESGNLELELPSPEVVRAKLITYSAKNLFDDITSKTQSVSSNRFEVELFDSTKVILTPSKINLGEEYIEWIGLVEGEGLGYAILHIRKNSLYGVIRYAGEQYQIKYLGDNSKTAQLHVIHKIDESQFNESEDDVFLDDKFIVTEDTVQDSLAKNIINAKSEDTVIDIMVVYTPTANQAASSYGGISALINLAISETNIGLSNSGTGTQVRLVHSQLVNYVETNSAYIDVQRLRNRNDSYLDSVHSLRDQYGADIVIMLSDAVGFCGLAYHVMTNPASSTNEDKAFAIVDYACAVGNYTFGHEIGHLMGARHNWQADPTNNSPYTFNHGYFDPTDTWRTIMSYSNNQCGICTRILYWSNPDQTYNGKPLGIPEGNSQASDNRKTLILTKNIVANYRSTVIEPAEPVIVPILYLLLDN